MDCINTQPGSTNGDKPKWDVIETTLSTMYGILLVSIYAAFQYTELVKFPSFYHWLEINGFFIYLYVISIIYFLYLLIFVLRGTNKNRNSDGPIKVVENEEVRLNCMMLLIIRSIEPYNIHHANTKIIFVKFLSESWQSGRSSWYCSFWHWNFDLFCPRLYQVFRNILFRKLSVFSSCLWSKLNSWSSFYITTAIHYCDISETESTLPQNTQQVNLLF